MTRLDRIAHLVESIGDDGCPPRKAIDYGEELAEEMAALLPLLREWDEADADLDEVRYDEPDERWGIRIERQRMARRALLAALRDSGGGR